MSRQHLKLGFLHCVLHLLESGNDAFRNEIHLDEVVITFGGGDNCELIYSLMDGVVSSSLVRSMKSCFDGMMTSFYWRWWFLVEVTSGC
jgi:hypothetical protein